MLRELKTHNEQTDARPPKSAVATIDGRLEGVKRALDALSPADQELVSTLVCQLAEREGITIERGTKSALVSPAFGFEQWKADLELRGLSKNTIERYCCYVRAVLEACPMPTELTLKAFLAERLRDVDKADSLATERRKWLIAGYTAALRSFFGYLYTNKLWNSNPSAHLRRPRMARRERRAPKLEEVRKLLALDLSLHDRLFIQLLLDTGMRLGELVTITKDKIDLERRSIVIMGKGAKERVVPISPTNVELIRDYLAESKNGTPYLFPSRSHQKRRLLPHETKRSFESVLSQLCDRAAIEHASPHELRHFVATFLLEHGADIKAVSGLLGHSDVVITLQIYHHVGRRNIEQMHQRLGVFAQMPPRPQIEARIGSIVDGQVIEH